MSDDKRAYVPVTDIIPLAALVYCTECGAVVLGDAGGQGLHDMWHQRQERIAENASWGGTLRPLGGRHG